MCGQGLSVFAEPEGRKEDLECKVGVERRGDVRERAEVPVDELGNAAVVVEGAPPVPPGHVQRPLGKAEVFLHVDEEQVDVALVRGRGLDAVGSPPFLGFGE